MALVSACEAGRAVFVEIGLRSQFRFLLVTKNSLYLGSHTHLFELETKIWLYLL
jgi:hypothetical protein